MSKKGENIYKRKDGRWEARYQKGYSKTGKIIYGYCYARTYKEAKEKVAIAKVEFDKGLGSCKTFKEKRLADVCDEWLKLNRNKVKESTLVKYTNSIENHIKPQLGGYKIHQLTALLIEEFSNDLLYEKNLSAKTTRDVLSLLKSILSYVKSILPNYCIPDIVYPKNANNEMRVLSVEEENKLIKYLLTDMDKSKFGVLIALMTGIRIGELCALRTSDISINERTLAVSRTMQRIKVLDKSEEEKTKVIVTETKSDKSNRVIPLTDFVCELCKTYLEKKPDAYVLTGDSNTYIEPRLLQYRFNKYVTDCGLIDVHFHTLRHSFATRCVEVGFEIKSLSEILGHSSPQITLERYVHSSLELKRNNMYKLAAIGF